MRNLSWFSQLVEIILLEATVVCLSMIVVYLLEAEFLVMVKIILKSVLIAIEPTTLLIDGGSCMEKLLDLFELLICLVLLDHPLQMTFILLVLLLTNV